MMTQILQLYQQMEELAVAQVELVKSKQLMEEIAVPLQELIDQRQECTDKIDKLLGGLSPAQKKNLTEQRQIGDMMRRILSLDRESQRMLKEIIEATSSKLIKVQDLKKANRAYGGQDEPTEAWFFDRKR